MVSEKSKLNVIGSNFTNSSSKFGGIIYIQENYYLQSIVSFCIFLNNTATYTLLDTMNSNLIIMNSTFENNTNIFMSATSSNISFEFINISNHVCLVKDFGCFINAKESSIINISFCNICNLISNEEGNLYGENVQIYIINSSFHIIKSKQLKGSCMTIIESNLLIFGSSFIGYNQNCIYSSDSSNISIDLVNFSNKNYTIFTTFYNFGTIFCENCYIFVIKTSIFEYNAYVINGAAIYLESTKSDLYFNSEDILIENCLFSYNSALKNGGAIYIFDFNATIKSNNFTQNIAENGGGIFLTNSRI